MPKKNPNIAFRLVAVVVALTLLAYVAKEAPEYFNKVSADVESAAPVAPVAAPPRDQAAALQALEKSVAEKRIVNTHEHIQDMRQVPTVLEAMDRHGIRKTLLMGSSWFTITLNERVGFSRVDENNEEILRIQHSNPERFEAWPTIDPVDPEKLDKIRSLIERGAKGVKLYFGHGYTRRDTGEYMFHPIAMDDPQLFPLYEYWQENHVPLCLHVNPFKPGFADELVAVLSNFPDLKVNAPHFMLSSIRDSRLREFFDTFPNIYSDVSFGHDDFLIAGLKRISKDPEKFSRLFAEYPDRFMFGTDLVMTEIASKTADWFSQRAQAYLDVLSKDTYTTPFIPNTPLRGLALPPELIENILYKNYERFAAAKPSGTKITHEIDWSRMGDLQRRINQPGVALPPPKGSRGGG